MSLRQQNQESVIPSHVRQYRVVKPFRQVRLSELLILHHYT